ncbi:hypothetical protein SAMN05444162_0099 [Paenibacillaceae bacterium GAS479]|nr:hypothetical protein SAMN05444162_0099 [Paenibacillaceae bacterium GAS479]
MPSQTPNLLLYKKDLQSDGQDTFNIQTMLNDNWDKLDMAVGGKVDKVNGKGLSTNDYSAADKSKLDGATSAATVSRLVMRDSAGRAKIVAPSAADDIARKDTVDSAVFAHATLTSVHGSTSAATVSTIMQRDSAGRAKVVAPAAADDIARKDTVDTAVSTHAALTAAHGATSAATASRIVQRDSAGRAKVAEPSAADDIARKDTVDLAVQPIAADLADAAPTAQALVPGLQAVTVTRDTPLSVKGIKGRSLINLFGRMSRVRTYQVTVSKEPSISSTAIKITLATGFTIGAAPFGQVTTKANTCYVLIGDLKNGNATRTRLTQVGGAGAGTSFVTDTTKFTTVYTRFKPTADSTVSFDIAIEGAAGQYVYADAVRLYEITQAEYDAMASLTAEQIAAKYPYAEGISNVNGVYVRNVTQNLAPPLSQWTNGRIYDGEHKFASIQTRGGYEVYAVNNGTVNGMLSAKVKLMPNTTYILSGVTDVYYIYDAVTFAMAANGQKAGTTFKTGASDEYYIGLYNRIETGPNITFKNVILTQGSTVVPFVPQIEQYVYCPDCQLAANVDGTVYDELYTDNTGQARATRRFKTMELTGDLAWALMTGPATTKIVKTKLPFPLKDTGQVVDHGGYVYKRINQGAIWGGNGEEQVVSDESATSDKSMLSLALPNAATGWGTDYTPTEDEIKIFFNGWMLGYESAGVFYWPYNTTGAKRWRPFNVTTGVGVSTMPATTTIVPDYTPYRLQYQLATPVDEPVRSEGAIMLAEGANTLEVGYGAVVRERARIAYSAGFGYEVNDTYWSTSLAYRTKDILNIYRDSIIDKSWIRQTNGTPYGLVRATIPANSPITSAVYEVTYLALDAYLIGIPPTQISAEYPTNQRSVTDELVKEATQLAGRMTVLENGTAQEKQPQWITPTLLNGWVKFDESGRYDPGYKKVGNTLYIKGVICGGYDGAVIFRLPRSYIPKTVYHSPVVGCINGVYVLCNLCVNTDGTVFITINAASNAQDKPKNYNYINVIIPLD